VLEVASLIHMSFRDISIKVASDSGSFQSIPADSIMYDLVPIGGCPKITPIGGCPKITPPKLLLAPYNCPSTIVPLISN
jgi:hypothetical protein